MSFFFYLDGMLKGDFFNWRFDLTTAPPFWQPLFEVGGRCQSQFNFISYLLPTDVDIFLR